MEPYDSDPYNWSDEEIVLCEMQRLDISLYNKALNSLTFQEYFATRGLPVAT